MKKLVVTLIVIFATSSVALADWTLVFNDMYTDKGLDDAVVYALSEGYSPDQIMKTALPIEGLPQDELIKALFCALAPLDAVYEGAKTNNIADEKVTQGYDLALAECPNALEEQAAAATQQNNPALVPAQGNNSANFASPSTFQ
ncbi:MAG: hypothetical protein M8357_14495 [Desulfobulbaceae bacterium]|nr:hypothetical protein [Desulfobulbaceae bacterium]